MYKLLLVEDNARDARIIQSAVHFDAMNIEIVGVATDGEEALELVERFAPNILLSDISMPRMNGIEMAQRLSVSHPHIKIVLLSSYDDFTYAQSAITLQISGYVLKPINPEEIERALHKAVGLHEQERTSQTERQELLAQIEQSLPVLQEEFLRELVTNPQRSIGDVLERMAFLRLQLPQAMCMVISMKIKPPAQSGEPDVTTQYLQKQQLHNILHTKPPTFSVRIIQNSALEVAFLLFFKQREAKLCMDSALEYVMDIHQRMQCPLGLHTCFGISKPSESLLDFPALLLQSETAMRTKFYSNGNPVILFSEIEDTDENPLLDDSIDLVALQNEIAERVLMGNAEDVDAFLDHYLNAPHAVSNEAYAKSLTYAIITILQLLLVQKRMSFQDLFGNEAALWRKLIAFETILDLRQWLWNIISAVKQNLDGQGNERNLSIVSKVKSVVHQRYSEHLSVSDIAAEVFLSPKQANTIFRAETGTTIFDYLMEHRMEQAKIRLKEPDSKVFLIAEEVGYTNISHFSLMFKRCTGLSPAEYKARPVL